MPKASTLKEIAPNYMCCTVEVSPFEQNCRIIWNKLSGVGVLIDPGADLEKIFAKIQEHQVQVKEIWLTHGHLDHAGEALQAAEQLQVEIIGPHIKDKELMQQMQEYVAKIRDKVAIYAYFDKAKNCTTAKWVEEGQVLTIDELEFKIMHWPGHSPGHVVYYSGAAKCLIGGDVVFYESVGRTDLYGSCPASLKRTIKERLLPMEDDVLILPGHGPDFTLGEIRHSNVFLVKWAREL